MPSFRGLPSFGDIKGKDQEDKEPKTSQLTAPDKLVKMEIIAVDKVYSPEITKLSVNPTTISERKASNWVKHNVPGQSDPLLQWINGSSRVVSFTAIVTKDLSENLTVKVPSSDIVKVKIKESYGTFGGKEINGSPISTAEGKILKELLNGDLNTPNTPEGKFDALLKKSTFKIPGLAARVDESSDSLWFRSITPYLEYYRSLVIPRTSNRNDRSKTPPLVQLKMGSILGNEDISSRDKWVLESYSITITKMSPDLKPIEATVGFTFIEYVDKTKEVNVKSALKRLSSDESKKNNAQNSNIPTIANNIDSKNLKLKTPKFNPPKLKTPSFNTPHFTPPKGVIT